MPTFWYSNLISYGSKLMLVSILANTPPPNVSFLALPKCKSNFFYREPVILICTSEDALAAGKICTAHIGSR